jgi:hypothetical protein
MEELNGKIISKIEGFHVDSEELTITLTDGTRILFYHYQACCEGVSIEDVNGNPDNHIGAKLYGIDVKSNSNSINPNVEGESFTWTFYTIKTSKGYLDVRWLGNSNGYYGEEVDYIIIKPDEVE